MLTYCIAACAHLSITVSEIQRYIREKIGFFSYPLYSTLPLGGSRRNIGIPFGMGKTRMVLLPDGEKMSKISLFVLAQLTNVTDGRTDTGRVTAYTALMHMHRAVTNVGHEIKLYDTVSRGNAILCVFLCFS